MCATIPVLSLAIPEIVDCTENLFLNVGRLVVAPGMRDERKRGLKKIARRTVDVEPRRARTRGALFFGVRRTRRRTVYLVGKRYLFGAIAGR